MTEFSPDHTRDELAVRAVEAAYDEAWNNGDIEALVHCLTSDAVVVNPRNEVARGRAEIMRVVGEFLNGPARGSKHRSLISRVEFIAEEVAIVDGQARIVDLAGNAEQPLIHQFTDVLVRRNGVWGIAHVRAYGLPDALPDNAHQTTEMTRQFSAMQPFNNATTTMIRLATLDDASAVADIYRPAVVDRPSSFELVPPDAEEMARRIEANLQTAPWLVYEHAGEVIGYANGAIHRQRPAYRWTIETSIYVDPAAHGQGIGRQLYTALLNALGYQGFRTAVAGVTLPNEASVALHEKMGYIPVGVFHHIGHKFGGWRDVAWFERPLATYEEIPDEPRSMEELLTDPAFEAILNNP